MYVELKTLNSRSLLSLSTSQHKKIASLHKQELDWYLIVAEKAVFEVNMAAEVGISSTARFKLPTNNPFSPPSFPPHSLALHNKRSHGFRVSANLGCHKSRIPHCDHCYLY